MKPPVIHYTIDPGQMLTSTYCSTLINHNDESGPIDHPGSFSARGTQLKVELYHGRDTDTEPMDDWGYTGPTFDCQSVAHDPDLLLLQSACAISLELAKRMGLATNQDTITIAYATDGVLAVPNYRDGKAAYFGDFSISGA
jgi:hypothetical protein